MASLCRITAIDHLVLTVASLQRTIAFYERLGMRHEPFNPPHTPGVTRHSLHFGTYKINLHESGREFEPKAGSVMPGSADLCFLIEEDVKVLKARLEESRIEILEGGEVVPRTGARGRLASVYIRDPDGNLIEWVGDDI